MDSFCSNTDTIFCSTWSGANACLFGGNRDGRGVSCLSRGPNGGAVDAADGVVGGGAATVVLALLVLKQMGGAGGKMSV